MILNYLQKVAKEKVYPAAAFRSCRGILALEYLRRINDTRQLRGLALVELIFTESSRQKKTVLLQNGETSTLQIQHKMT